MRRTLIALSLVCTALLAFAPGAAAQGDEGESAILVGAVSMEQILEHDQRYADAAFIYVPDSEALEVFCSVAEPVTIKLFYRSDCSDSVREVPGFIKTIELADNPLISVECVGVNYGKDEPAELLEGWNILYVPTFIVVHEGREVGRVVETAEKRIEVDLAQMLRAFTGGD